MSNDNSTTLYSFLQKVKHEYYNSVPAGIVCPTAKEMAWLERYLQAPDHELHFQGRLVGHNKNKEPMYDQHFQVAGEPVDIFSLLTEAMLANGTFAETLIKAHDFYLEHVPGCPTCQEKLRQAREGDQSWKFLQHAPLPCVKDLQEFPCQHCDTGEMVVIGFTQPNGGHIYRCNNAECGHQISLP